MHIRIRKLSTTSKEKDVLCTVSKSTGIQELQQMITEKLNIPREKQQLYHGGKLLTSNYRITDYDIKLNDVIQLLVKEESIEIEKQSINSEENEWEEEKYIQVDSQFYKRNEKIDVIDNGNGAWFEAKILDIYAEKGISNEDDFIYKIKMDRSVDNPPMKVKFCDIRPRSYYIYKPSELKDGMIVFVNYNIEEPGSCGYWYDFKISQITRKFIKGSLLVGKENTKLDNCIINVKNKIMRIENVTKNSDKTSIKHIPLRELPLYCTTCKDDLKKNCRECGCFTCGGKENMGILILCDECDNAFHLTCLEPPLAKVPSDPEWYCPDCKTDDSAIVKAGEKLKISKSKMKMASNKKERTKFDWGKGMACVGRTSECTLVPKDHYGPIPGIEVGTCWKFRLQVSEAGIHRPHVAGIHGRENDGAYSLVLSGGYEDDIDNGEEFFYTGSGGRDLSGNRRVNEQSCDQKLTRMNKALALNCNVEFNDKIGGEAEDWKNGKPVRVVRNYKLRKHSKFAPSDGNRYDGIYKVVKYYPEKGLSGFVVWRYLLRRDDPIPAPWQKGGKEFEMIYPPGHLEAEQSNHKASKRKHESSSNSVSQYLNKVKKPKMETYNLSKELQDLIELDKNNAKFWNECLLVKDDGKQAFLQKVEETFVCICCQDVMFEPVTMTCNHNVCKICLKRSFAAEIFICPYCRCELGEDFSITINESLDKALRLLFPGYEAGR